MSQLACTKCGVHKAKNDFYVDSRSRTGAIRQPCKACRSTMANEWQKRRTKEGDFSYRVRVMATKLLQRVNSTNDDYYSRNGIECRLGSTIQEVADAIIEYFSDDIQSLLDKGVVPSVDRVDPQGHYELGNIRIIPAEDNRADGFRNANKPRMKMVEVDGKVYDSIAEAAKELGIDRRVIAGCLKSGKPSRKYGIQVKEL